MTGWRVLVPFNHGRALKTRLAALLDAKERRALALAMATHVVGTLAALPEVARIALVSPERPPFDGVAWIADPGHGLNAALAGARAGLGDGPVLFLHADLPLLAREEVAHLLAAASEAGAAIAPDADGIGTNALALADARAFAPAFGPDSFARHRAALPGAAILEAPGLGLDVDTPENLRRALALGMALPSTLAHRIADIGISVAPE